MGEGKKSKIWITWSKVFIISLLVVLVVRSFFVESFTVSSVQMETSLLKGDKVFVNRTSYGIRMPITILAVPFTFDNFFGFKSYSDAVQLDYKRVFKSDIDRNDVVVFNNPIEKDKPLDRRRLCISRCVAVGGDTITINGYSYLINGKEYVTSPDFLLKFSFNVNRSDTIKKIAAGLNIPLRNFSVSDSIGYASFNKYEAFLINQNLSDSLNIEWSVKDSADYKIVIPRQGQTVQLTEQNILQYRDIIISEIGNKAKFENNQLFVDGVEIKSYIFRYDYYWFLSDNVEESLDSRYFGFISEKDIIGKASYIWFSSDNGKICWDRIFTQVK